MNCKECEKQFKSAAGLHRHINANHDISLPQYYHKHYPRFNKYTGRLVQFKDRKQYLSEDFSSEYELISWCKSRPKEEVQAYLLEKLKKRIKDKNLKYLPTVNELQTINMMPSIKVFESIFGSYNEISKLLGLPLRLKLEVYVDQVSNEELENMEIIFDTRETLPLKFPCERKQKLEFGDYTTIGQFYSKTFVERKASSDFKSTLSNGFDRFKRELKRAKERGVYLYIVVDDSIGNIITENETAYHKVNLSFVFKRMRELQSEFDNCQFVFSGGRFMSEALIPKLLYHGSKLWNVDIQYFLK